MRFREGGRAAALAVLALLIAAPAARADGTPFRLSHVDGISRWAPVLRRVVARAAPSRGAPAVATLSTRTGDGTQNLVLALERVDAGALWVRVRLAILPNGSTGWVPRSALGEYHAVRTHLVIDRGQRRARLLRSGRVVFRARIGVGRPGTPTPAGEFYVRDRLRGFGDPFYGPLAFGLSARSAVLTDWPGGGFVGVHGTNQPGLLPGRVSHGCIRLRNPDVLRLGRLMPVGTPVTIR
jgi:lipoprotein-anchoring transpeptidase ErfK/SrfK